MASPAKFAHVVYQTRRYDEMIAWYEDVFEAKVVHRDPALAFLTYDDEHHRFAFANLDLMRPGGDPDARGEIGTNHVAYTYADTGALLGTYARLKARGIEPYWRIHHGTTLSLYYRDPDGNRMEFQVDALPMEEAVRYMQSETFHANPVGVEWDPGAMIARRNAGASEAELLVLPPGAPSPIPIEHGF